MYGLSRTSTLACIQGWMLHVTGAGIGSDLSNFFLIGASLAIVWLKFVIHREVEVRVVADAGIVVANFEILRRPHRQGVRLEAATVVVEHLGLGAGLDSRDESSTFLPRATYRYTNTFCSAPPSPR